VWRCRIIGTAADCGGSCRAADRPAICQAICEVQQETITELKNVPLVTAAVRDFIARGGYGEYFIHRTGHSIGSSIHANGANLDDLEIGDEREIIPNTCFSMEPGIYMPDFGVRSEVNVLVRERSAEVTGRIQTELVII
jgi:Xaa-Pro aminopeptidase